MLRFIQDLLDFFVDILRIFEHIHTETDRGSNERDSIRRRYKSQYRDELVEDFENLASGLAPSDKYVNEVHTTAEKIFKYLKLEGFEHGLHMVRAKIAGSIGKHTGISYFDHNVNGKSVNSDLDLVIFVDEVEPPFEKEFRIIGNLLTDLDGVSDIEVRKFSVGFNILTPVQQVISVDLLLAKNNVWSGNMQWEEYVGDVEAIAALKNLDEMQTDAINKTRGVDQKANKLLSSAFAEKTVRVIRDMVEDEFVLNVVRLAKYWNSRVDFSQFEYVSARSCIIESIAINAQRTESSEGTEHEERCIISGFIRFLESVRKFNSLDICLDMDIEDDLKICANNKPVIRDPVNKWNNLTEEIPSEAIEVWEQQAQKTLSLLEEFRNSNAYSGNTIDEIFSHKSVD